MPTFKTIIQTVNGATAAVPAIYMPFDVTEIFGKKNRIDINGVIEDMPIERSLIPAGDGLFYIVLNAKILKSIAKKIGDEVTLTISGKENETYKEVTLPDYFLEAIAENPAAQAELDLQNPSGRRWIANSLAEAKNMDTKANRVIKIISVLERRYGERKEKESKK